CRLRFQFDDNFLKAQEIGAIQTCQSAAFVMHRQLDLPAKRYASLNELHADRFVIYGLQKPMAKFPMHFHRRADDSVSSLIAHSFLVLRNLRNLRTVFLRMRAHCTTPLVSRMNAVSRFASSCLIS